MRTKDFIDYIKENSPTKIVETPADGMPSDVYRLKFSCTLEFLWSSLSLTFDEIEYGYAFDSVGLYYQGVHNGELNTKLLDEVVVNGTDFIVWESSPRRLFVSDAFEEIKKFLMER